MYKKEQFIKFLNKFTISNRRKLQILKEIELFYNKISIIKKPNQKHFLQYIDYVLKNYSNSSYCYKLSCLNKYREFLKMQKFTYKFSKKFYSKDFLTFTEYRKLLKYSDNQKYKLIIQTFFLTGIRFSELENLTVESLNNNFSFFNKKAFRKIPLHRDLKKSLIFYCSKNNINTGPIFLSNRNNPLSYTATRNILKIIAAKSKIKKCKVTKTHNFRRLFISYASQFLTI